MTVLQKTLLAISIQLIISCNGTNKTNNKIENKIDFPDSLEVYNHFKLEMNNEFSVLKNPKYKLFIFLNVACSSCLSEINKWGEISSDLHKKNVECIYILYSKDKFRFFKHLYEKGEIKRNRFPFLLDTSDYFLAGNPFVKKYMSGQNYLTDTNQNILLEGDFINSEELQKKLFKTIDK